MTTSTAGPGPSAGPSAIPAATVDLEWEPVDPDQVVAGNPQVGVAEIAAPAGFDVGVWAHTAGVSTDVEADEVFVVLSGRATIEFTDGTVLEVGPGDVGILPAGASSRWTVHEDLRKVYVLRSEG